MSELKIGKEASDFCLQDPERRVVGLRGLRGKCHVDKILEKLNELQG